MLLLQSGENASRQFIDLMCRHVEAARRAIPDLVLILCFGTLKRSQLQQLRNAGGDRYILKFETANPRLYAEVKPGDTILLANGTWHDARLIVTRGGTAAAPVVIAPPTRPAPTTELSPKRPNDPTVTLSSPSFVAADMPPATPAAAPRCSIAPIAFAPRMLIIPVPIVLPAYAATG